MRATRERHQQRCAARDREQGRMVSWHVPAEGGRVMPQVPGYALDHLERCHALLRTVTEQLAECAVSLAGEGEDRERAAERLQLLLQVANELPYGALAEKGTLTPLGSHIASL